MKILLRAALTALSIANIGPAFAGDGEGPVANTRFTEIPGVVAQAQPPNASSVVTAQNGQGVRVFATQSNHGSWLFAPNGNQGANS